jgi:hypothetical protein
MRFGTWVVKKSLSMADSLNTAVNEPCKVQVRPSDSTGGQKG